MKEEWKDIPNMGGAYQASSIGRIRSVDRFVSQFGHKNVYSRLMRGRIIKPRKQNGGYLIVWLSVGSKIKPYTVHRLVLSTFSPNGGKKMDVNHKDGNKENNSIDNLEWCNRSDNIKHSYEVLKRKSSNKKPVRCIDTGEMFSSIKEAGEIKGINKGSIGNMIRGRNKTAGGLRWEMI